MRGGNDRRLFLAAAVALLVWTLPARAAAQWQVPPLDGSVSGATSLKLLPNSPKLTWRVSVATPEPGKRVARIAVEGDGTHLELELELHAATGNGTWALSAGRLDAGTWWRALAPKLGAAAEGVTAEGVVELEGKGEWREGGPMGVVKVVWREGGLRHEADGWALAQLAVAGDFAIDAARREVRSEGPFELTIGTITTTRFGARNFLLRALLEAAATLVVREARIEIAGGDVTLDPCTVPLSPLVLDLKLRLTRVGLQDLAALVPDALAAASGRVDGVVGLRWSEAEGLQMREGHLAVRKDEPAEVRLAPTPGLISASLPAEVLKHYPGLGQIETGEIPLRAELLEVTFTPDGDSEGRTAHVHLAGGPVDPKLRAPVDLTVNVRGPLESLIKLGTSHRLQFGGR
ncbi:hypothetical protein Oter_4042 [Opitutus terrae PB90-1]|uniref:Uncharacterized protein n=1 Tax=Opitutus terrae (strain DSM 11246 / JCM 15787 / PB90-1) TaxID=452637 RepID=B1ZZY0_OPITP|nr:hypothetical protein Oter_4042 [Opitutus terrae PB90-1]